MLKIVLTLKILLLIILIGFLQDSVAKTNKSVSLKDATENIQKTSKGKVLSAQTKNNYNGTSSHRVKVLTPNGRIKVYHVPTGEAVKKPGNNRTNSGNSNPNYHNNTNRNGSTGSRSNRSAQTKGDNKK